MFARILAFILFAFIPFFLFSPALAKNTATSSASFDQNYPTLPLTVSSTSPLYTDLLVSNLFHSFTCLAAGQSLIGQPCLTYQLAKNAQGIIQSIPVLSQANLSGGAIGTVSSLITALYMNPPIRSVDYLASMGKDFGIIKEANAQVGGSGNLVLNPVIALWRASRNISYVFITIIFMIIGLMVMFRNKINPQTVISAQAALPGLIVGLILITFSYFLAALAVDFSFIGINVVGTYFESAQISAGNVGIGTTSPAGTALNESLGDKNVFSLLSPFVGSIERGDVEKALNVLWDQIRDRSFSAESLIRTLTGFAAYQFGASIGAGFGAITGGGLCLVGAPFTGGLSALASIPLCSKIGEAVGTFVAPSALGAAGALNPPWVMAFAISFIMVFIMLYAMGKLFLRLINSYISIIFYTIIGPFLLLISALPGRQGMATGWVKGILGNVLAFPAVGAGIYLAGYLLFSSTKPSAPKLPGIESRLDIFGQAGTSALPLLGGIEMDFLRVILAFGIFIALPSIPDVISKSIGGAGGFADLIGREIQGNIGGGRGLNAQWDKSMRGTFADYGQYRQKWYRDPYEHTGVGARIQTMAGAGREGTQKGVRSNILDTMKAGVETIHSGRTGRQFYRGQKITDKDKLLADLHDRNKIS